MTDRTTVLVTVVIIVLIIICTFYLCSGKEKMTNGPQVYYYPSGTSKSPTVGFLAGVHGNEPAGSIALQELISFGWFDQAAKEYGVNIIVVPRANESGLQKGVRWTNNILHPDLNRSFNSESGDTPLAGDLLEIFKSANLIVDFHEGWGWHRINKSSIGSTVSPSQTNQGLSDEIGRTVTNTLNNDISNISQYFTFLPEISCDIRSALSCYMELANREYILVETTGQKNVQPMSIRTDQVQKTVKTVLSKIMSNQRSVY